MMHSIQKLKEISKDIVVLYVEDEEVVRANMLDILNLFFNNIHTAANGEEGLKIFKEYNFDLVITDIRMPKMNGLEMLQDIRDINPYIPVIITTAFNDQDYFIRLIGLRVDKYLIKPIELEKTKEVFFSVVEMIDNRRKAKELEIYKMQEKINNISNNIVQEITNGYQNPCIIYTDDKVRYVNDTFLSLFEEDELKNYIEHKATIDSLFDSRKGFIQSLNKYDENDLSKNRISISKHKERKIYRVIRKEIDIDDDKKTSLMYIFNDITLEEYQKIKIQAYTERLEELIIKTRYKKSGTSVEKPLPQPIGEPVSVNETYISEKSSDTKKLVIDEEENNLLRRSHVNKTTAKVYVAELDKDTLLELQELDELDRDFSDSIILLQENKNIEGIHQMSNQLERYAHEIGLLFEFGDLSYAIKSLAALLKSIDNTKLDENIIKKITIFLSGIQYDLSYWRQVLFVDQSAIDIHYLDSSLFSACLQIELVLSDDVKEMESEEDDLILF